MNRRLVPGLVSLLLAFVVASGTLLAQSAPIRIVEATDGTLYVLKDGARYAIVAEPIGDDELASYVDGGPSGAALLLNAQSAAPAPASADVAPASAPTAANPQFVSVQGNSAGRTASVTVQAAPGTTCSLSYITPAGTRSTAAGLGTQTVGAAGVVTWSFLIGGNTRSGTGTVTVTCGGASISSPIQIG